MSLPSESQVDRDHLLHEVSQLRQQGHRFVTMTCLDTGSGHELLYHFDRTYQLHHLRLHIEPGQEAPSISSLFFAAAIVENEIKDLFGVQFSGLAIDYQGRLVLTEDAPKTPMNKNCGMKIDARVVGSAGGTKP